MRSLIGFTLVAFALSTGSFAQSNLTGAWAVSFTTPNGAMDGTATFKQDGEALTGTMSGPQGEVPLKGSVKGKNFTFSIDVKTPDGTDLVIHLNGEVDGDSIKGTFDFGQGMGDWTGKRNK